jgi:hypothetical protein
LHNLSRIPLLKRASLGRLAAAAALVALGLTGAHATDYTEGDMASNPIFVSGDRLLGSTDFSDNYILNFTGASVPGLYRYIFDLDADGSDSFLNLYDASASSFLMGASDDFPGLGSNSRIIFDQFQLNSAITQFEMEIGSFGDLFDYTLTVTRTDTPVTSLGLVGSTLTSVTNPTPAGAGTWYSFTLGTTAQVTLDTLASLNDDTEIALFDANGNTIGGNDDATGSTLSELRVSLQAGTYYVAVGPFDSLYNWNTTTNTQTGWNRNGFSGGGDSVTSSNNGATHTLQIVAIAAPEPGTLSLLGMGSLGLMGAVAVRRKRKS